MRWTQGRALGSGEGSVMGSKVDYWEYGTELNIRAEFYVWKAAF
jgi:hypothetical protein